MRKRYVPESLLTTTPCALEKVALPAWRIHKGLSQQDAATALGLSVERLSSLEAGHTSDWARMGPLLAEVVDPVVDRSGHRFDQTVDTVLTLSGWTVRELAEWIGVGTATATTWWKGMHKPRPWLIYAVGMLRAELEEMAQKTRADMVAGMVFQFHPPRQGSITIVEPPALPGGLWAVMVDDRRGLSHRCINGRTFLEYTGVDPEKPWMVDREQRWDDPQRGKPRVLLTRPPFRGKLTLRSTEDEGRTWLVDCDFVKDMLPQDDPGRWVGDRRTMKDTDVEHLTGVKP